ncbi:MAG TPA: cytochrome d ubiquinol oxidase subunit II, partial [Methylomirabilota bacterium]
VFLTLESHDPELVEDFRRRALWSGGAVFVTAWAALLLSFEDAPLLHRGLLASSWAMPLHLATAVTAIAVFASLWYRRYAVARIGVGLQVSLIVWGWAAAQYPFLVPPDLTVQSAAAPQVTLRLVLLALALGAVVLVPSMLYLFRVFKSAPADRAGRLSEGG